VPERTDAVLPAADPPPFKQPPVNDTGLAGLSRSVPTSKNFHNLSETTEAVVRLSRVRTLVTQARMAGDEGVPVTVLADLLGLPPVDGLDESDDTLFDD
jgi:hypothetical protein